MATTWEYATIPLIIHNTKGILDQWGADGWELVQVVTGPDGNAVTGFEVEHDKQLHLIVVRADGQHFAHVHPRRIVRI